MTQIQAERLTDKKLPVYVSRPVLNPEALIEHYQSAGYPEHFMDAPGKWHVTVVYSRQPIDWVRPIWPDHRCLELGPMVREHKVFDSYGAYQAHVLAVSSITLRERHEVFRHYGASHDYPDLNLHITIGRAEKGHDYSWMNGNVKPYDGNILLGPERLQVLGTYPKLEQ